ncbi:MAG: YjbQ family protein [Bdellovibrionaceae bacterium]|nr:secondary thiamine-phosphate synthase enzyme YjbQ [Bdellovibrionales bacterium]MCB9084199.1 YjbQ family protein [Pseudobdellovibrionaceae bacterium]
MFQTELRISTHGKGLYLFNREAESLLEGHLPDTGLVHLFLQHTSASLVIQENADPTAKNDLETFMERLAPEDEAWHTHTVEGPDDTTSHLKSALTQSFLVLPVQNGRLALGTWQGLYLWEHRRAPHTRRILITVMAGQ